MNAPNLPQNQRLLELLADRALEGLDARETQELESLIATCGLPTPPDDLDLAAAALQLGMMSPSDLEPLPAHLREALVSSGQSPARPKLVSAPSPRQRRLPSFIPWFAAAAGLTIASVAWLTRPTTPPQPTFAALEAPDKITLAWSDWDNPEVRGVTGQVVWSDQRQQGVMKFTNLPKLDDAQYQLWIVDSRGMGQRISGGIFNGCGQDECEVPIAPGIRVQGAAAFAVTIEKPGGTWVSDMTRRVVIAAK